MTYCFLPGVQLRPCNDSCMSYNGSTKDCHLLEAVVTVTDAAAKVARRRPSFRHPEPPEVGGR